MSGNGSSFRGNTLHHVAIAAKCPDVVIEQLKSGAIKILRQPALSYGHTHAVGNALSKRSGGCLDARSQTVFWMARRFTAQLPKVLNLVERNGQCVENFALWTHFANASEMQQRVQQHRGVSIGEHEAIAIRPDRIFRVIAQKLLPQAIGYRSQRHRSAWVARVCFLYRVHRKSSNRIDTQLIK